MISTRHLTLVPRRQHQILSTGASVRPRFSHVRHVAEVGVVDHARPSAGWNINDRGPIPLEIQHSTHIHLVLKHPINKSQKTPKNPWKLRKWTIDFENKFNGKFGKTNSMAHLPNFKAPLKICGTILKHQPRGSIRVRSEPQGSAIHQTSKDTCLVTSIAANGCKACSHGLHWGQRNHVQKGMHGPGSVQVVIDLLSRRPQWPPPMRKNCQTVKPN